MRVADFSILFLAADLTKPMNMTEQSPLFSPELQAIAACSVRIGGSRDDFIQSKSWILVDEDEITLASNTVLKWIAEAPPAYIFAFDADYVVRRISACFLSHNCGTIPAYYWAGRQSRTADMVSFLTKERDTNPRDLLNASGIPQRPHYEPHADARTDLKNLLSLATRYGLLNTDLEMEDNYEIPPPAIEKTNESKRKKVSP